MSATSHPACVFAIAALLLGGCVGDDGVGVDTDGPSATGSTSEGESTGTSGGASAGESETSGEADILELLEAIPGMSVVERTDTKADGRFFELTYQVPVDHGDPDAGDFGITMTLIHRAKDAPMVLYTTGYHNYFYDYEVELSRLVGGNQLSLEKRFTGASIPDAEWTMLNAAQVAADGHAVVEALKGIYDAPWLRTGASLGGEDAVYHHYFYADDFAGVVSYVAPFVLGLADTRFVDHFANAAWPECQAGLEELQARILTKEREGLVTELELRVGLDEITRVGTHDRALQTLALELPWNVWQSFGPSICESLPAGDDPELGPAQLIELVDELVGIDAITDKRLEVFEAYSYQAFTQLGRPALPLAHLGGLIDPDYVDLETGAPPLGIALAFDGDFLPAIHAWVATQATDIVFVYGDLDPWSAGKIDAPGNPSVATYHNPDGIHGTSIAQLSDGDRMAVEAEIAEWLGGDLGRLGPKGGTRPTLRVPR